MKINRKIFRKYDIRGVYPGEINESAVYLIGKAFGIWLRRKNKSDSLKVVVSRDVRSSSDSLKENLTRGLIESGLDVVNTGLSTSSMHYYAINELKADGGLMVTASHNPVQYNGIKFSGKNAASISLDSGLSEVMGIISSPSIKEKASKSGVLTERNIADNFIEFITNNININCFNIVIDAGNGMSSIVLPKILKKIGVGYKGLNFNIKESLDNAVNPAVEKTLKSLKREMAENAYDFGVAFDTDADRIGFLDSNGKLIRGDLIISLVSEYLLKDNPREKIVFDLTVSKIVEEVITENGGMPIRWKVGHAFIKEKMREEKAIFGGEISGHYYFRDFFYADSTFKTLIQVLQIIKKQKRELGELIKKYEKYFHSGRIAISVSDSAMRIKGLESMFSGGKISRLDGLTVEYPDWWFNIRPSNTESIMRLVVEAEKEEVMKEKTKIITSYLRK